MGTIGLGFRKYVYLALVHIVLAFLFIGAFAPFSFPIKAYQLVADAQSAQSEDEKLKEQRKQELKAELNRIQQEVSKYRSEIQEKRGEERSLATDLSILNSQISKAELELRQTALAVRSTEISIETNNQKINDLSAKIQHEKEIMAELMRAMYEEGNKDFVELVMTSGNISDFVDHQRLLDTIQASLNKSLQDIKASREYIEEEQKRLADEKEEQERLMILQEAQNSSLEGKKSNKAYLLGITQGQKAELERAAAQKQRDINEIRSRLFLLEGAGVSMSLGEAYEIAKFASGKTGVRPAFILAILKQESSWGKNVGQCVLSDPKTGVGAGVRTGNAYDRVMSPTRDVPPFLQITAELGKDPYSTPVSCPHPSYGWGGAMGPAQFIPSTWMGYRDRGAKVLGHIPDPWNLQDSFTVSGIKLANGGATSHSYNAEWKAAMIYYAGGNWNNPVYSFYGDSVMDIANAIQAEIDAIGG